MSTNPATACALTERISTRICHDLAGPLGAISNGIELLADLDDDMQDDAMDLVQVSAQRAIAQIQFFRYVFGTAKHTGDADLQQCRSLCQAWLNGKNITLDWSEDASHSLNLSIGMPLAKAGCIAVMLAAQSILTGGTITVSITRQDNQRIITATAQAERLLWKDEWSTALLSRAEVSPTESKTELIDYMHLTLAHMNHQWTVNKTDDSCAITLSCHQPDPGTGGYGTDGAHHG